MAAAVALVSLLAFMGSTILLFFRELRSIAKYAMLASFALFMASTMVSGGAGLIGGVGSLLAFGGVIGTAFGIYLAITSNPFCKTVILASIAAFVVGVPLLMADADAQARAHGFADAADERAAKQAGYLDPAVWTAHKPEWEAQQKTAGLLEDIRQNAPLAAMNAVRPLLKDPYSAQFGPVTTRLVDGDVGICGSVNSKNGFGAYGGYKDFVVDLKAGTVSIDGAPEFNTRWNKFCG